jgi:hypothetical protein
MNRSFRRPGRVLLGLALLALGIAAASPPAHRQVAPRVKPRSGAAHASLTPAQVLDSLRRDAVRARMKEDDGAFVEAMKLLRSVRGRTAPDADLELWLAMDEARCGYADSAWARLDAPLLRAAAADTAPPARWREYGPSRPVQWLDGRFTGWHWYVAHARAELALERGDWSTAEAAARVATQAQPLVGREHLLLALAAGRAGDAATARAEAALAATLDPLLPEAHYLAGLWDWRDGNRAAARAAFESAIAADSGYREPALALVRMRLPGTRPDSLPVRYLDGVRRVAMLTSPERPKPEESVVTDTPAGLYGDASPSLVVPDSLASAMQLKKPVKLLVTVLVDESGRPTLSYFPYLAPAGFPVALMHAVMRTATTWRFRPATRFGRPVRAWISVEYMLYPPS